MYRALTSIDKVHAAISAPSSPSAHVATTPPTHARSPTPPRSGKARLPKISLPRFNGDIMKWTAFWDSYKSAVHDNDELSDVDKFNYLRSLLERTAYEAIAGLTLSSANYGEAIDILVKRFGNKQRDTWTRCSTSTSLQQIKTSGAYVDYMTMLSRTSEALRHLGSTPTPTAPCYHPFS